MIFTVNHRLFPKQNIISRSTVFETYQVGVAFLFEAVEHHGLTAAPRHGPRRADEDPDKRVRHGRPETLGKAEVTGRHPAAHISSAIFTE